MSNQSDNHTPSLVASHESRKGRAHRRGLIVIIIAIVVLLCGFSWSHTRPSESQAVALPSPAMPEDVQQPTQAQRVNPEKKAQDQTSVQAQAHIEDQAKIPEPPSPMNQQETLPQHESPSESTIPSISFNAGSGYEILSLGAESDSPHRQSISLSGGTTILGHDRAHCHLLVRTPSRNIIEYYFYVRQSAGQMDWQIHLDQDLRPTVTINGKAGRKALPGLRIDRQFMWTKRGVS